ncbi:hypothetical protein BG006_008051 [Podila minutissima]|uniref:Uncharacterized protein n=1 Tax=Podila minutissima TaxID=64525 RepID=A0A9P5SGG9_9FUNG|nr:hypothetical protein BG006_008051 [Podila minutissima]
MYPRYREKPKSKSVTYSRPYLPPVYQYPPELFMEELEGAVMANTGLQDLNISIPGGNEINRILEYVFPIWSSALRPMRLTLFERTLDRQGRVTAQVVITGRSDGATIHRAELSMQLSHSSALSAHCLIYSSPLTELYLENVQFQNKHDWNMVIQAVDYSLIEVFVLSVKRSCRPKSAEDEGLFW